MGIFLRIHSPNGHLDGLMTTCLLNEKAGDFPAFSKQLYN